MSWVAFAFTALAVFLSARQNIWNWGAGMVSNILWIIYACMSHQPALALCQAVLFGLSVYGLRKWHKDGTSHNRNTTDRDTQARYTAGISDGDA